ncbi:MAG: hypothetical protein KAU14_00710 [Thermoplasmata archaeon]|nr:hypothetical protein [Thermoplasmata archaeon]
MGLTQEDIHNIVFGIVEHNLKTDYVARIYGISQRRVQQFVKHYRDTGEIQVLRRKGRKPFSNYPPNIRELVLDTKTRLHAGTIVVARYLRIKHGIKIRNGVVHRMQATNRGRYD